MVDDEKGQGYHLDCLELKKEKEISPLLFAKVERLENEIMAMKSNGKAKNREGKKAFS
ncbi:17566_t:CDS:1, partial [Racocetra persica]